MGIFEPFLTKTSMNISTCVDAIWLSLQFNRIVIVSSNVSVYCISAAAVEASEWYKKPHQCDAHMGTRPYFLCSRSLQPEPHHYIVFNVEARLTINNLSFNTHNPESSLNLADTHSTGKAFLLRNDHPDWIIYSILICLNCCFYNSAYSGFV